MTLNNLFRNVLVLLALYLCTTNAASIDNVFYDIDNDHQIVDRYNSLVPEDPEMKMKACELVEARGYACEVHEVETKDGYILTIHRIPVESKPNCTNKDRVLLLNHGFLGSATDYLINNPKQSLVEKYFSKFFSGVFEMASVSWFCSVLHLLALCLCGTNSASIDTGFNDIGKLHQDVHEYNWFVVDEPEMTMEACQLAKARGYECEDHIIETIDGYSITIHRIPVESKLNCTNKDRVLILNHPFLGSSADYLINSPKQSLGYLFSDVCYDVWMVNARGNRYGLKHNIYIPADEEFWKFSFDEMAEYDMPAFVDYILQKTKQKSLFYIGHSQATMIGFQAFSENQTLAKKIRLFGALSPVGYLKNTKTAGNIYASMSDQAIYLLFGRKSFLGPDWKREFFVKSTCTHSYTRTACIKFGEKLGGKFSSFFNQSRVGIYFMQSPAGSSVQNLVHWAQLMRSTKSTKYAYPTHLENVARYGSWYPPEIKFSQMNVPTAIFSGGQDTITDPQDLGRLMSELPNVVSKAYVSDYGHLDFIYATNSAETIFKPLLNLMKNY